MRSFRQKVFLSYIVLLLLFLGLMFASVTSSVQQIVFRSMNDCADELISELVLAKDDRELILILKHHRGLLFYRVGVVDGQCRLLYDSHTKRLIGAPFFSLQSISHPEIGDALKSGMGYSEQYSHLLDQKLAYMAKRFEFHGQPYVLRLAFPFQYIQDLKNGFTYGFVFFGAIFLVLFSVLSAILLNHFSSPIRVIINSIRNYHEGNFALLPHIRLKTAPNDEFTHLANTLNSLSQRVRLEIESVVRERNEREAILESLCEGVVVVDSACNVSYVNKMALQMLGFDRSAIGQPILRELNPKCQRLLEQCCEKKTLVVDEVEINRGPDRLHLSAVAAPRDFGGGALLVLHDKSVQYRMLEMRKAFIANASHELKTPITVIRGFAETLYDNVDLPKETVQEVTARIVANCGRMTAIIKNLLTLADIENLPAFRVAPHDIVTLVQACAKTTQSIWPDAKIALEFDPALPFCLEIDSALLELAITNLLDNATKYSEGAASIEVRLSWVHEGLKIEIEDHGIGIPEADIEHIFQRFYRVNKAHSSKLGGSGLGLSIVETIVRKHLGKITVSSTPGKGTTFTLILPSSLAQKLHELGQ